MNPTASAPALEAVAPLEIEAPVSKGKGKRLLLVGALLVALFVIGHVTGVTESVTVENLRRWMAEAGPWGIVLFVAVFLVGELVHVPGLVFVAAGVLSYGQLEGGILGFLTALASISFSFAVVRGVGGKAMAEIKWAWVRKILSRLDDRPILTVALLRAILCLAPPLNYALALSSIRFRDYLIGSTIGLIPPIALFVIFFDKAMVWLGVS